MVIQFLNQNDCCRQIQEREVTDYEIYFLESLYIKPEEWIVWCNLIPEVTTDLRLVASNTNSFQRRVSERQYNYIIIRASASYSSL